MPDSTRPFAAVLPWYGEADFAELLAMGGHGGQPHDCYQLWYRSVMQTVDDLLREGVSVEFVTIRPAVYTVWLDGRENTLETRREFAKYLVTRDAEATAA